MGAGAKTGVETVTQIMEAWSQQEGGMVGGGEGDGHMSASHREVWSQVSHDRGKHRSERGEGVICHDMSN